jgi:predicted Na+-dependent transporter
MPGHVFACNKEEQLMTLIEFFGAIAKLSGLTFVVASMVAMGLSLTMSQIIAPLRNVRLVILSLLANFVLVPLIAYVILRVIPLAEPLRIGLILLATAAGAPFLPKLAQVAKGNIAFSVGLMVLLMVVTIIYMPLVLPLVLSGVAVDPWAIAQSLIVLMLLPLGIALFIRAKLPETAATYQPVMNKVSSVAILILLVVGLSLNLSNIVGLIGSGGILALLLFLIATFAIGFVLGLRVDAGVRSVMGLGTAQRNISAAIVVGASNFTDPTVITMLLVAGILGLLLLMPIAHLLGNRVKAPTPVAEPATPVSEPAAGL